MRRCIKVDCTSFTTIDDFHDFIAKSLSFPSYYGRNQDAFWDCISEIVDDTTVEVRNLSKTKDEIREKLSDYIMLMHEYETESKGVFHVEVTD